MRHFHVSVPVRVTLLYALFGSLWIFFTDQILELFTQDKAELSHLQTYKGWVYIVLSAALIFFLLQYFLRKKDLAEAVAREQENRYRQLFETSQDAILMTAPDGSIYAANPAACRIFGRTEAEIIAEGRNGIVDQSDPRLKEALAERALTGYFLGELSFVRKNGEVFPGEISTSIYVDHLGRERSSMIIRDISERKRHEETLQRNELRFRSTLDNLIEGGQIIGFDWRYIYINGAAEKHNRRPKEEILGNIVMEMWPGIDQTRVFALEKDCMEHRRAHQLENEFVFPDGSSGWFDLRIVPVDEGIFILSIDITERKRAELALEESKQNLEKANIELEHRVAQRTVELNAAMIKAQESDRLKSAFLATMSHELRTPLNSIIGFTGILLQGLAGDINPEQIKQMNMIRTSSNHLLELINDVLDLSKIEANQLQIRKADFDLRGVVDEVLRLCLPEAQKKGLALSVSMDSRLGVIHNDRRRVSQILINLVNNGIKFTEHGEVKIQANRSGDWIELRVIDTGIGIKAEDGGKLFAPFHQIDSGLSRRTQGTGLGLSICKKLAILLGGDVTYESEWGKGSTFTLTLPYGEDNSATEREA